MSEKEIDNTKYSKYLKEHTYRTAPFGPVLSFSGQDDFQSDFSMFVISVDKPNLMETYAHSHEFDMYLVFSGMDPNNMNDFGAEIELFFGEEGEKHVITKPTVVYIPKGTVHCPLNFKRVDKPVLFLHATLAPRYKK
jgi:mannose-6-phosphate isomerase-like protein (cupin superfamily)